MENKKTLREIRKTAYEQLCKSDVLVKKYSKIGLKTLLHKGIKNVNLEARAINGKGAGAYSCEDRLLTIFYNQGEKKPTINTIKKELYETLIHEAIHATLRNYRGTGLDRLMIGKEIPGGALDNQRFEVIGVGFNEGYTNWILETTGLTATSYDFLTEINRQIALCIGQDRMISFSSGSHNELFRQLNMSKIEGTQFLRMLDEIYYAEDLEREMFELQEYLEDVISYLTNDENRTEEWLQELESQKQALRKNTIYKCLFSEEIQEKLDDLYGEEYDGIDTSADRLEIYKKLLEKLNTEYIEQEDEKISIIAGLVEDKILQKLVIKIMDDPETPEDMYRLLRVLDSGRDILSIYDSNSELLDDLLKDATEKLSPFMKKIYNEIEQMLQKGKITGHDLEKQCNNIIDLIGKDRFEDSFRIRNSLAGHIAKSTANIDENRAMINYIIKYNLYDQAAALSVQKTKSGTYIIFCNGVIDGIIDEKGHSGRLFQDDDVEYSDNTDFSKLEMVKSRFYKYKMKQNTYSNLYEIGKIFIYENNEHYEFFDIIDGENPTVKRAELLTQEPIRSIFEEEKNVTTLPVYSENSIFARIRAQFAKIIGREKVSSSKIQEDIQNDVRKQLINSVRVVLDKKKDKTINYNDHVPKVEKDR